MDDKKTAGIGKGTPGPGRPKGTPNRATADVREAFATLLENNTTRLQEWLDATAAEDPARALELITRLAEFVTPKLSRSQLRGDGDAGLTVTVVHQGRHLIEQAPSEQP